MKNFYKYLISGFCLSFTSVTAFGEPETVTIGISIHEDKEEEDLPSKGKRIPAAPILCTIDFENQHVDLSISEFIYTYELWDEDGTYQLASYTLDSEFVCYLSNFSGAYQLRLVGENLVFLGYLDL